MRPGTWLLIVVLTRLKINWRRIEGKSVTINGGNVDVYATDDGVNAANANASQRDFFKMTGGTLNAEVLEVRAIQTQIDSNGDIIVSRNDQSDWSSGFWLRWFSDLYRWWHYYQWWKQTKIENFNACGRWSSRWRWSPRWWTNQWLWRRSLKSHRMNRKGSAYVYYYLQLMNQTNAWIQVVQDITHKTP